MSEAGISLVTKLLPVQQMGCPQLNGYASPKAHTEKEAASKSILSGVENTAARTESPLNLQSAQLSGDGQVSEEVIDLCSDGEAEEEIIDLR